ncbi:MAG TPA: hypothetical protein VEA16_03425 [Vicinamibacterales bacterium]|nr:hypothetical protein [Vicinamibacterales bacterium]
MLGFLTLLVAGYGLFRWRLAGRWNGQRAMHSGFPYQYEIASNKGRVTLVRLGIDCATGLHVCLMPERGVDRFFKSLGLSQEQQLDDVHFDNHIYLLSDDRRFTAALAQRPEQKRALADLFRHPQAGARIQRLWCRGNRLWVEAQPLETSKDWDHNPLVAKVIPVLRALGQALSQAAPSATGSQDRFVIKAMLLLGVSSALAINAVIQLIRAVIPGFPVTLDHSALLGSAFILGLALIAALVAACIGWLGRTSRMHVVLLELLFVGGFGAFGTTYTTLRNLNIEFDQSMPQHVASRVTDHYTKRCGKSGRSTCYHVAFDTRQLIGEALSVQVNYDLHRRLTKGAAVRLLVRRGALGFRWMPAPEVAR